MKACQLRRQQGTIFLSGSARPCLSCNLINLWADGYAFDAFCSFTIRTVSRSTTVMIQLWRVLVSLHRSAAGVTTSKTSQFADSLSIKSANQTISRQTSGIWCHSHLQIWGLRLQPWRSRLAIAAGMAPQVSAMTRFAQKSRNLK